MRTCLHCYDTSPDDALFCIGCGTPFGATGATQRMTTAGVPTFRIVKPSSMPSAQLTTDTVGTVYVPYRKKVD